MDKILTKRNVFLFIPICIFSVILILMLCLGVGRCDEFILNILQNNRTKILTVIALIVTNMCTPYVFLAIILILLLYFKNKKIGLFASFNLLLALVINQIIKHIVARQRPLSYMLIDESGYSFPSAHSMMSTVFYGYLMYIIFTKCKNKTLKIITLILFPLLIFSIALTRIYLGVHYPSDIFAGILFGYIYLLVYITIIKKNIAQ